MEIIDTIAISLANDSTVKLERVVYAPKCDSNLIFLSELRNSKITFVDNADAITSVQGDGPIIYVKRDYNLFILDLTISGKVMQATNAKVMATIGKSCLMDLVSKNK